jgi:hypothetical protein
MVNKKNIFEKAQTIVLQYPKKNIEDYFLLFNNKIHSVYDNNSKRGDFF